MAGTVVAVHGEPGELAGPGEVVIPVSESSSLVVKAGQAVAWILAAAIVAGALAGCSAQRATSPSLPVAAAGTPGTWMLTRSALSQMLSDSSVRPSLERTRIYELLQPGQQPLTGVDATPVVTFSSVASLRSALARDALPAGTRAVLYDPEVWPYTPASEQRDPVRSATEAAELAHARGLQIIVSPALNLTTVLEAGNPGPHWRTFLDLGLAGSMARVANTVELQAQSLERDPAAYASFVREAAAQARAGNPNVTVLAGLSTNPPGATVDSQQITAAIQASQADVDGYWLNIPGDGARCPACHAAQPSIGAAVLSKVL